VWREAAEDAAMKAKPWQIALIVIGLAVGLGSVVWFAMSGDTVGLDRRYFLVDVESGDIFEVDSSKYRLVLPARHPETGRVSLVGVSQDDDGTWFVSRRDLDTIKQLDREVQVKAVDTSSGDLVNPPGKPRRYETK
jgi:hypothetical protein